jgi:hypothetical protein
VIDAQGAVRVPGGRLSVRGARTAILTERPADDALPGALPHEAKPDPAGAADAVGDVEPRSTPRLGLVRDLEPSMLGKRWTLSGRYRGGST